jgi:tetrahydromethanopterin S-methyltransferase subunit G
MFGQPVEAELGGAKRMDDDIGAMYGIVLGVLSGATLWLVIYAATIL